MQTLLELLQQPAGRRFSLVIQGGGMRGVYSAGALACFDSYHLQDSFISVSGSSAGAMNGAYFLAHQPGAVNVYIKLLSNKDFVDFTRKRKRVDIDYMVDVALHQQFPIELDALEKAKPALDVVLTDADDGSTKVITHKGSFREIYEEFRATSAMPILYDKKIPLQKHYFVDGGVSDLIPIDVALEHKPTDIIVLMTRPLRHYTKKSLVRPALQRFIQNAAKYQSASVREILPTNLEVLHENIGYISAHKAGDVRIWAMYPRKELKIGRATIDKTKLEIAGEQGWQDADNFLHQEVTALFN